MRCRVLELKLFVNVGVISDLGLRSYYGFGVRLLALLRGAVGDLVGGAHCDGGGR